ncbi:hypothetical protein [Mycobacterium sp.]|uniref:hypothetical protein n=1 Tax=Mycobacterium sp. TaxID=1785 RepID=UPI003BB80E03
MSTSSPSPRWRSLPSSSLVDVLYEDEDIDDVVALSGDAAPQWLTQLSIPTNWQLLRLPETPEQVLARMAVFGPLGNGEWQAADTINVIGFTGWPTFYDVYRNADGALRGLDSRDIAVKVLPVPLIQWTAAVRSSGTALLSDRSVWIQQSHYVAGSEQRHASRLTVHTILIDSARREQLAENITHLSDEVYQGFINALMCEHHAR